MVDEKIVALAKLIHGKTIEGKVRWEKTVRITAFQTSFNQSTVKISQEHDMNDDTNYYCISLYNDEGILAEEVYDYELKTIWGEAKQSLKELYHSARRTALGVDRTIDEIIASLESS